VREALSHLTSVPIAVDFTGSNIVYRNQELVGTGDAGR
jgi:hypothetical protein